MTNERTYDVTVYGATGFTGQLIAEYLAGAYGAELKLAIAGRNESKLKKLKTKLAPLADLAVLVGDASDGPALEQIAIQSGVIIQAAGPYTLYGRDMVAACAATGTDYVDLCGESNFQRDMIQSYQADAEASGARIVHACGFDSVPSDLGVFHLQQIARSRLDQPFNRVKGRVEAMTGTASGGTVASIGVGMEGAKQDPELAKQLMNPFALTEAFIGPRQPNGDVATFDDDLGTWAGPFVMASINTKTVHRTNYLLRHAYGEAFQYDEMIVTGAGDTGKAMAESLMKNPAAALGKPGELPKPGEGPSKAERDAGHFTLALHGQADKVGAVVRVKGFQDPGYGSTSKQISEAALCLLKDDVTIGGGLWTPASAMGEQLITRLASTGVLEFTEQLMES